MKKFINLFVIASLFLIGFTACENNDEGPGNIPGMGETPGELEIKEAFTPPEDINISVQSGDEMTMDELTNSLSPELKSTTSTPWYCGGGGSYLGSQFKFWIRINLTLTNTGNEEKCVLFPIGLIFKVQEEGYQNGILLHDVNVCIPANSTKEICMFAFCLNKGRDGSNANLTYTLPGTTGSDYFWNVILNNLMDKNINIENFLYPSTSSTNLKSTNEEGLDYYASIADQLQNIVWTVTNDDNELSQEQIDFMKSLPKTIE
ncbi:MAG: hypothetical protein GXO47_11960 [Chlorobi bacterium]|nr:hypothetical protein [Chlorobiota bacterium]